MENISKPLYVTQPAMPPLDEYLPYLLQIWESRILTNNGPFHQLFEKELASHLGVQHLSLFTNGTLALVTALQSLRITGEVITTPFSFVATTHSLWWNNIKPVFVDIEPDFFTIDPEKIEAAITPRTTAILAVHVYGNPCQVEAIQRIADTYGLKVIYDAAHAFGVTINGQSILNYGDLSVLSFHATKAFNTFEGGAIISTGESLKKHIDHLKNFGFEDELTVIEPGINAKMNELQAAFGLVQLNHLSKYIARRKAIADLYRDGLSGAAGIRIQNDREAVNHSYAYYPILVDSQQYGESRDALYERLKANNIYGRRYFYPLISQFPTYRGLPSSNPENLPVSTRVASQVICLPLYPAMVYDDVNRVLKIILEKRA